jgi:hypothetical protein
MGWLKEIFSPTPDTFYTYAMRNSRFLKKLTFKQTAAMHSLGQSVGSEYLYPNSLTNGMIGPPHSMFGEYLFLAELCDSDGDTKNKEQLDVALEKFTQEFSKEKGYNFS